MTASATRTKYLIVGASHAALEAATAIRMYDTEGSLIMASRESHEPYSPTVLPYVVSGQSRPERIALREASWFGREHIDFLRGLSLVGVEPARHRAHFANGSTIEYERLLLATGAAPAVPPIPGLETVKYHVLRTLDDALELRAAAASARSAVVLGAGLVGMHAAENLARAGVPVVIIEKQSQVLPGYFDARAAAMIRAAFEANGVELLLDVAVTRISAQGGGTHVTLADEREIDADLLLVATGVRAAMGYLEGSVLERDAGILVDEHMRTNAPDVWAAGDVAQARSFLESRRSVSAILPSAVEQGRIAGMAMCGDPALKSYAGAVPLNTYHFFGQHAISVGAAGWEGAPALEDVLSQDGEGRYLKFTLQGNRLKGIFGINVAFDPGIMWQLILRELDLSAVRTRFLAQPQETGRALMSQTWR